MPAFWQFTVTPEAMLSTVYAPDDPSGWLRRDVVERPLIVDRFELGEAVDGLLPTCFRLNTRRKTVPDAFHVMGGWPVINGRFRRLLDGFDTGACRFYPIDLLWFRGERIDQEYFIIQVVEKKDSLIEGKSEGEPFDHRLFGRTFKVDWSTTTPRRITLSSAALHGADLWCEARDWNLVYASDALNAACKAAKITRLYAGPVVIYDG